MHKAALINGLGLQIIQALCKHKAALINDLLGAIFTTPLKSIGCLQAEASDKHHTSARSSGVQAHCATTFVQKSGEGSCMRTSKRLEA